MKSALLVPFFLITPLLSSISYGSTPIQSRIRCVEKVKAPKVGRKIELEITEPADASDEAYPTPGLIVKFRREEASAISPTSGFSLGEWSSLQGMFQTFDDSNPPIELLDSEPMRLLGLWEDDVEGSKRYLASDKIDDFQARLDLLVLGKFDEHGRLRFAGAYGQMDGENILCFKE